MEKQSVIVEEVRANIQHGLQLLMEYKKIIAEAKTDAKRNLYKKKLKKVQKKIVGLFDYLEQFQTNRKVIKEQLKQAQEETE